MNEAECPACGRTGKKGDLISVAEVEQLIKAGLTVNMKEAEEDADTDTSPEYRDDDAAMLKLIEAVDGAVVLCMDVAHKVKGPDSRKKHSWATRGQAICSHLSSLTKHYERKG